MGAEGYPGIGGAMLPSGDAECKNITIKGEIVTAQGGAGAAGIGTGRCSGNAVVSGVTCDARGATITAEGGAGGAGVGSGLTGGNATVSDICLADGLLYATGGAGAAGIGGGSALQGTSRASDIVVYDVSMGAYGSILERGAVLPAIGAGSGATRVSENIALNPLDECWITAWKGNSLEELDASEPFVRYESQRVSLDNLAEGCLKVEPDDSSALRCAGTDDGYSYDVGDLVITGSGTYTVSMNDVVIESEDGIVVAEGAEPTIVLDNVDADVSKWQEACALRIEEGAGDVTLLVKGENTLASGSGCAGIQKDSDRTTLTIANLVGETAECSLVMSGGDVASIGGDYPEGARIVASDGWLATAWRGATDEEASRFLTDAADPFDLTGIDDEYVKVAFSPKPSGGDDASGSASAGSGGGAGSGSDGGGSPRAATPAALARTGDPVRAAALIGCVSTAAALVLFARRRVR